MFPPMANPNLEIKATEFERLVRDWILKQGGELTSLGMIPAQRKRYTQVK